MKFRNLFLQLIFLFLAMPQWVSSLNFAHAESAKDIKSKEAETRQYMVTISRQLGVTCTECHNMKNLADSSMKSFQVAKDHMKIVELLKTSGMDGKNGPEASCYMCHQGNTKINYKEKLKGH